MKNICFVTDLNDEELKSIEGGKNLLEYAAMGFGWFSEWAADHDDFLGAPRPIGMY